MTVNKNSNAQGALLKVPSNGNVKFAALNFYW